LGDGNNDGNGDPDKFRLLVEGTTQFAMFLVNPDGRVASWNEGARRILGYEAAEIVGQPADIIFTPEDQAAGVPEHELATAAREGRALDVRWHRRKDGSLFFADGVLERLSDEAGAFQGFAKVLRDATERAHRERRERFLAELAERARTLTDPEEVIADAVRSVGQFLGLSRCVYADIDLVADTCSIPVDYCADESVKSIAGVFPISGFGAFLLAEYRAGRAVVVDDVRADPVRVPLGSVTAYEDVGVRAHVSVPVVHSARLVSVLGAHSATPRHWTPDEVELLQTVVERTWLTVEVARAQRAVREAEQRERARLNDIFMRAPAFMATVRGPRHVFEMANPPYYQLVGHRDILGKPVAEALPEVVEQGFIGLLDQVYQTGEPFVGKDVPIVLQAEPAGPRKERFVDFIYQPLLDEDGRVSGILAHGIDLTERKRLEQERERLLGEQRARAEREALLNQIGAALRASDDPEEVQARAVALLGEALHADRCYFNVYDPARRVFRIGPDWHRPDLSPMAGEYALRADSDVYQDLYPPGRMTAVHEDVTTSATLSTATIASLERRKIRSFMGVVLSDGSGSVVASLRVAMTTGPRAWTPEEVALVESVATLVRSALESARAQQREHNIAQQLQTALQPPVPETVPGLELGHQSRAALDEANVGGDFLDVFLLDKGCTALVVGDLSGKGLAAAAQVATVRNMLRFALYNGRTLDEALTALNRTLVENHLIQGFATLFVGCYDSGERTLTYVNCGQEPALLRRAAMGQVEELEPTGPVLGSFTEAARFEEQVIALSPGDALAVFTDGLTEAGPNRREMMGVSGVASLLARHAEGESASDLAQRLVADVDAYARGGVRDDVALLVGIVKGS
jgi:PAS domain S-box-containing protein